MRCTKTIDNPHKDIEVAAKFSLMNHQHPFKFSIGNEDVNSKVFFKDPKTIPEGLLHEHPDKISISGFRFPIGCNKIAFPEPETPKPRCPDPKTDPTKIIDPMCDPII